MISNLDGKINHFSLPSERSHVWGGVPLIKEKPKMFAKGTKITHAAVIKKLNEILQARGKRTDRAAQIEPLQLLVQITSETTYIIIKIKFNITTSLMTTTPNLATYVKPEMWQKRMDCINELMNILFANPNIFVRENILEESENMHNTEFSHCVSVVASSLRWNEWMKNLPK